MKRGTANIIRFLLCALLVAVSISATACERGRGNGDITSNNTSEVSDVTTAPDKSENELDNYAGTLKYNVSDDGKSVNISYMVDGEQKSYTVPNNVNYLSGGFAATDDLSRSLPNSLTTGIYGENGEKYVGLFYFLWHGEHGDTGVYDLQKIMDTYGDLAKDANAKDPVTGKNIYGAIGQMHWFAEPLYGYYYASDEWVIRKHMELLSNANIDFLYFDVTNGYIYKDNALKVMKVCHELNEQGYDAPQVVFYTNANSAGVMKQLYNEIYKPKRYSDTWFYVDGKPCIIGVESGNIDDFFTVKAAQWPNEDYKTNGWPWMDFEWPQRVFKDSEGNDSAISVSIAQHNRSITFSDSSLYGYALNRGRSFNASSATDALMQAYRAAYDNDNSLTLKGLNFQAQWDRAIESGVPYVLVTGWNEWVAQRQDGALHRGDASFVHFVDTASMEFSRDAEMMRGGYFDNYYMQLIANVGRLKGLAPAVVQDARNRIDISGDFAQWDKVIVSYTDPEGDTKNRNSACFGKGRYTDFSGNNDIVCARVTSDSKYVYFYVKTRYDIKQPDTDSAWMQLFVNTDRDAQNGWYGYDYVINSAKKSDTMTCVARCSSVDGVLSLAECGEVSYRVEGNQMMIAVPQSMLGIAEYDKIYIEFKWVDADEGVKFTTMEDFYTYGDVAPLGRLNWIYQNYIPS
ncbi:MAG: hypothetical protein IJY27_07105 [Clostridia bacterium]|nr:hypothetical protein [Clostridia bacterium]